MDNYEFVKFEQNRNTVVARNTETNKLCIFKIKYKKNGKTVYKKITKEFNFISKIANVQERPVYVEYLAFDNLDRIVILNTGKKIKINSRNAFVTELPFRSVEMKVNINNTPCIVENFSRCEYNQTSLMLYQDSYEILYSSKKFGEFLYNISTAELSNTYDFISPKNKNGYRIAKFYEGQEYKYVYINKDYKQCDEPFMYKVVSKLGIKSTILTNGEGFYAVNSNFKCNSKLYNNLEEIKSVLAETDTNNYYKDALKQHTITEHKEDTNCSQIDLEKE